ncbi:MAG: DUF362 domain-containing protein [Dehalococcoidia bacterium]|nr:DUF362 domain-containing protein [Dehalococcoidia bacterium]
MKQVVEQLRTGTNLSEDVETLVRRLGGIESFVHPGERVLIKPSCNSPFAFPATTDLPVISAVVTLVRTITTQVSVGDSSGFIHKPTHEAFDGMGLSTLAREMDFPLIDFDEHDWTLHHNSHAHRLKEVHITEKLSEFDRIIFLPTVRTHAWARISLSLKVGMGFLPVKDRKDMHRTALEEMLGEMNLYFKPDLVIMDGRKCFISGGPDHGTERSPGILLASTGRVAIDTEAVRILQSFHADRLDMPAEDVPMIRIARELGLP